MDEVTEFNRLKKLGRVIGARESGNGRNLALFVGGLFWSREESTYDELVKHIADSLPDHDVVNFPYNPSILSTSKPDAVSKSLRETAEKLMNQEKYHELKLVGHSFGTVLIRAAVLDAHKNSESKNSGSWYSKIDRLLLLAPTNRGYEPTNSFQSMARSTGEMAQWLPIMKVGRQALSVMRGSSWLNNLRLRWLQEFDQSDPPPFTIVILGRNDRIVGDDDTAELYQFPHAVKEVVPNIGHGHFTLILKKSKPSEAKKLQKSREAIEQLKDIIRDRLSMPIERVSSREFGLPLDDHRFEEMSKDGASGPPIVFLVHGIRDFAEWQDTLGAEIRRQSGDQAIVVPVLYGYFTALQFLYRTSRLRAMRSFVDRYVQMRAVHPRSTFHVAAHSNGTWVVAYSLRYNAAFEFENVYFCGSVLSRLFPWHKVAAQIKGKVRNDCANQDWPVGVLCSTLSWIPFIWSDLGSGGVDGFIHHRNLFFAWLRFFRRRPSPALSTPKLENYYYLKGDHGAALNVENHSSIAAFVLGNNSSPTNLTSASPFFSRCKYFGIFAIFAIAVGLVSYYLPSAAHWLAEMVGATTDSQKQAVLLALWTAWILVIVSRLIKI